MAVETVFANLPSPRASPAPRSRYRALADDGEEGPLPPSAWNGGGPTLLYGWEHDGISYYAAPAQTGGSLALQASVVAPDGKVGAVQLLKEDATTGRHLTTDVPTLAPQRVTSSVYAKAAPGAKRWLVISHYATTGDRAWAYFDVVTGAITQSGQNIVTANVLIGATIAPAGNGYFKCSLTSDMSLDGEVYSQTHFSLSDRPNNTSGTFQSVDPTWTGDSASGLYLWRFSETGLLNGGEADGSALTTTPSNDHATTTTPAILAPDGTTTGVTWAQEDTTYWRHGVILVGVDSQFSQMTLSCYAKAAPGAARWLQLTLYTSSSGRAYAYFDLVAGVLSTTPSVWAAPAYPVNARIEAAANGWWKCTLSADCTSIGVQFNYPLYNISDRAEQIPPLADANPQYTGDGTSGLYLWRIKVTSP